MPQSQPAAQCGSTTRLQSAEGHCRPRSPRSSPRRLRSRSQLWAGLVVLDQAVSLKPNLEPDSHSRIALSGHPTAVSWAPSPSPSPPSPTTGTNSAHRADARARTRRRSERDREEQSKELQRCRISQLRAPPLPADQRFFRCLRPMARLFSLTSVAFPHGLGRPADVRRPGMGFRPTRCQWGVQTVGR